MSGEIKMKEVMEFLELGVQMLIKANNLHKVELISYGVYDEIVKTVLDAMEKVIEKVMSYLSQLE